MATPAAEPRAPANEIDVDRLRPGWVVLLLAVLTAGLTGPGQTIGVSVFIDHFVVDLDLTRSQVSGAYLVGTLTGAALLPFVGRFVDRRGVRFAQVVIGLLFGLALVNMSLVTGLVTLAIGFAGIRFLGQGSLSLVSTVTVQVRFRRTRGTALGIFTTASAGLMALVPVALAVSIDAVGWRRTWLIAAATVATVTVTMAWIGLRGLPRGHVAADRSTTGDRSLDRAQAMRTAPFWMLASVTAAAGMMSTALNFHQIDLLGDAGISETAAAALFVPQVVGSTLAGLCIGYLGDRVGTRYLPAAGMVLLLIAQLFAAAVAPGAIAVVYAVVLGASGGAVRTAAAVLQPAWFGLAHVGSIQGALTLFGVGASAVGPVVLTLAEEWLGSYPAGLLALLVVPIAALICALGPNRPPAQAEPEPAV